MNSWWVCRKMTANGILKGMKKKSRLKRKQNSRMSGKLI